MSFFARLNTRWWIAILAVRHRDPPPSAVRVRSSRAQTDTPQRARRIIAAPASATALVSRLDPEVGRG